MLSGLHELANKMSDPFGDDESDLNVDAFLNTAVEESRRWKPIKRNSTENTHALVKH